MHFYEASIITTNKGLHCQVYGNEHPPDCILVKPKYIPTDKIECNHLQYRFLSGKKMNRLNLWIDKKELKEYLEKFKKAYPSYIYKSTMHDEDRLFFCVPINEIERIYFPKSGLKELMSMPVKALDHHLKTVYELVEFLLKSGLRLDDLGITYSTLMGHYLSNTSDINIVVYGKGNFWRLMEFLGNAEHPLLRWKSAEEWLEFYSKRNRYKIFDKEQFLRDMARRKSEGFFNGTLFVIFAVEKEDEVWFRWGSEKYEYVGIATIEARVEGNHNSSVRPGCYEVKEARIISPEQKMKLDAPIRKIVFYSRDYCMLAVPGEKISACGVLERVKPKNGIPYYRVVVGYFDAYITDRREKEFIKTMRNGEKNGRGDK